MTDPINLSSLHVWQRPKNKLPFEITPLGKLRKDGKIIPRRQTYLFLGLCPPRISPGLPARRKATYHDLAHEHYGVGHNRRIFHDGSFEPIPEIDPTRPFEVNWQSVRWIIREWHDIIAAGDCLYGQAPGTDVQRWYDAENAHRARHGHELLHRPDPSDFCGDMSEVGCVPDEVCEHDSGDDGEVVFPPA